MTIRSNVRQSTYACQQHADSAQKHQPVAAFDPCARRVLPFVCKLYFHLTRAAQRVMRGRVRTCVRAVLDAPHQSWRIRKT